MSGKKYRAARRMVQDVKGQVFSVRRRTRFYYPFWRMIVGLVFPSVKTKFRDKWEIEQEKAFKKVEKKLSHGIAVEAKRC